MSESFEEWKNHCRAELYRIQSACFVTGPSGREESIMSESGDERRNMLMALLNIAGKSKSAKEALALIAGEYKDDPAINVDQAKPFVEDLRKVGDLDIDLADEDGYDDFDCEHEIVPAKFTSVWDGGTVITTGCMVDLGSREIFDIELSEDVADTVNELDREYVTVGGVKYHAVPEDKREDNPKAFWYA